MKNYCCYLPIDSIVADYVNHPKILEYETHHVRGPEEEEDDLKKA